MPTISDFLIVAALLFLVDRGWRRGILRTLLGPVSLVTCCFVGFFYYQKNQNIPAALLICIVGPFILTILASLVLKIWHKTVNGAIPLSPVSKLLGCLLNLLWGGSYLIILLILIGIAPIRFGWFGKVQENITGSKSYALIKLLAGNKIPAVSIDIEKMVKLLQDPAQFEKFESSEEFQTLAEDSRLQNLFSDEETVEQIRTKNFTQLISNPKIQAVFQDKELLKKMFALNKKIMKEDFGDGTPGEAPESRPRVIDIEK